MRRILTAKCLLPIMGCLLTSQVCAQIHSAHFDGLAEGGIGTSYTEDSLLFSDLDRYLGSSNETFVAEAASGTLAGMPGFSSPNTLGFGGYSPGPGAAFSRCGTFKITTPGVFDHGELSLFIAGGSAAGNQVTLEARLAGSVVGSQSVTVPSTFGPHGFMLSVSAVNFDSLHLVGTGGLHSGSFFGLVDSVSVDRLATGTAYCFGDGSGTNCPCGNSGAAGEGCSNSTGLGGLMDATGSTSVAADDLRFQGTQLPANRPALCFSGATMNNGGAGSLFGDGLLCVSGGILRHDVRFTDASGQADWGPGFAAANGWLSGDTRNFQVWYRDPSGPCGAQFNTTNAFNVTFTP